MTLRLGLCLALFAALARATVLEQSYIDHAMVEALGWTEAGVPVD